jgi:hypothetical protein
MFVPEIALYCNGLPYDVCSAPAVHRYVEVPGATHGPIIEAGMADIFAFFAEHRRGE